MPFGIHSLGDAQRKSSNVAWAALSSFLDNSSPMSCPGTSTAAALVAAKGYVLEDGGQLHVS